MGRELLERYKDVPQIIIRNHNNIEEMRKKGEEHIGGLLKKYFPNNRIVYFS